ncbi:hypothetical protein FACS1894170_00460 [Planctomycetales bacterium]|nr:hypothetical protein FACS1894170_00460 [Planctomycetales bacterium]
MGSKKHLTDLLSHIIPWHCLVCCRGFGGDDLPTRVNNTVKSLLEGEGGAGGELYYEQNIPQYVQQLISNGLSEPPDDDLRTITIIRENS